MIFGNVRTSFFLLALLFFPPPGSNPSYKYFRIGPADAQTTPGFGIAMMGGGTDQDEAFRWLCEKANGGDFLVLRAHGDDAYNSYVNGLCKLNSVATLIIPDRKAANDLAVADYIHHAEAVFIAGGDQANYINFWRGTRVQDALNAHIAAKKPIGGTSAGLAVLGEFVYGAMKDEPDGPDLASTDVLPNPYSPRVTLIRGFLNIPLLKNTLTDSHFAKRDRMGRTLVFLARIMRDGWSKNPKEVAIDEKSAVLVEEDGKANVVGSGKGAYFIRPTHPPEVCRKSTPLTFSDISVYRAPAGAHFDLKAWSGAGGTGYTLSVKKGAIQSSAADGAIY